MRKTSLNFWKMSGAGNDFIVLPRHPDSLPQGGSAFARSVCPRGISVGADGVLFVVPGDRPADDPRGGAEGLRRASADAILIHYNPDGGRSPFCGNGSRCAARFAVFKGIACSPMALLTDSGILRAEVEDERVRIEVPAPSPPSRMRLAVGGEVYDGWHTLAGVPHLLLRVDDPETVNVAVLGPALRSHPGLGGEGANIDFLGSVTDRGEYPIRTFERGVEAETLACGSGAIAAAAVLAWQGIHSPVRLRPRSGIGLIVDFTPGPNGPRSFHLSGEARIVFEGVLDIEGPGTGGTTD